MEHQKFKDRSDAGRQLAELLKGYRTEDPLVIALPRGGVPVGHEVAKVLGAPLDVLVVRKLGTPHNPELAMGAIGPNGVLVLNEDIVQHLGITDDRIERVRAEEQEELESRLQRFRGDRPFPSVEGRTVILVDNGIATGSTAKAALRVLRDMGASRIVLGAAVMPRQTVAEFDLLADEVIAVAAPEQFGAVGYWYEHFDQTSNAEVEQILASYDGAPSSATREATH